MAQDGTLSRSKSEFDSPWERRKYRSVRDLGGLPVCIMEEEYIDVAKASDLKNKQERIIYRLLEMVPGLLSVGTLLGVFLFSWLRPSWVAIFMICFSFYYFFRILYFSLHQVVGYF